MSNTDKFILKKITDTITNGWVNHQRTAMNPLGIYRIEYINPKTGKKQAQSYMEMQDLIIPVIIKKDNKTGEIYFAMQYEYVPSSKYGIQLELPDFPFFNKKKDNYTNEDVISCLDENLTYLRLDMIGFKYLDSGDTAVNQSISDQIMIVVYVYVRDDDEKTDNNLEWFPISSLQDYLFIDPNEEIDFEHSCMKSKYALRLFYEEFKNDIKQRGQTKFVYKNDLFKTNSPWNQTKTIMRHEYRFGETLAEIEQTKEGISNYGSVIEMGTSKNSVECIIVKREIGKIKIGLSKQQRSPFIAREGIDEFFYE